MKKIIGFVPNVQAKEMGKGTSGKEINKNRRISMTIKDLIEKLQKFSPNAEVRVVMDLKGKSPETIPASSVGGITPDDEPRYIGFSRCLNKKQNKKSCKKVVIF